MWCHLYPVYVFEMCFVLYVQISFQSMLDPLEVLLALLSYPAYLPPSILLHSFTCTKKLFLQFHNHIQKLL